MAVREYVGARYVPIFSELNNGVWDNTYSYGPLTIVKYGTDFYTSKIPVPVGVDITNTDYWVKTGDYNGAITALQDEIDDVNLNKRNNMSDRTFLFLADSYEELTPFLDTVAANIGCKEHIIKAMSHACFVRHDAQSEKNYLNIITTLDPLTSEELNEITDVVIVPTINDRQTDDDDLYYAMNLLSEYFVNHMPKLQKVLVCSAGWLSVTNAAEERITNNLRLYSAYCPKLGWGYVDCTRVMKLAGWTGLDSGHPSQTGADYIGECVAMAILTGSCSWVSPIASTTYDIALPASWLAASPPAEVRRPDDSVIHLLARCNAAGEISWRLDSDIFIRYAPMSSFAEYIITLTPRTDNWCPLPIGARIAELFSVNAPQCICWYENTNNNGLEIHIIGGDSGITTVGIMIQNTDHNNGFYYPDPS